jgi:hypothetical protein
VTIMYKASLALAAVFVSVAITIGIVAVARGRDASEPVPVGELTQMEQSGDMHDILERHRQMLQQMQVVATPQMFQLMNNDPMWQMLRGQDWARLDEEHQADIDRMLGQAP